MRCWLPVQTNLVPPQWPQLWPSRLIVPLTMEAAFATGMCRARRPTIPSRVKLSQWSGILLKSIDSADLLVISGNTWRNWLPLLKDWRPLDRCSVSEAPRPASRSRTRARMPLSRIRHTTTTSPTLDLSDFFYIWLKRSIGFLYPDDLGGELTPKRSEAISVVHRHGGDRKAATEFYESTMAAAFVEAHRVLKPGAPLVCIYAHKTTLGWATLVEALRTARFMITEAWPLDTEMPERSRGRNSAALASSIFLVARRRDVKAGVGTESDVMAELDKIIAERLERLQQLGVTGADLVIATVGAGLRPLTRYERVEQDNGEMLPAERFLAGVVQGRVLGSATSAHSPAPIPSRAITWRLSTPMATW